MELLEGFYGVRVDDASDTGDELIDYEYKEQGKDHRPIRHRENLTIATVYI